MKNYKKNNKIIVEKTKTGFSAYSEDYPIFTSVRTIPELINNALEATQLNFEEEYDIKHENLNIPNFARLKITHNCLQHFK